MFGVEEAYEVFQWVAVGDLRECAAWSGRGDDVVCDVAEIESGFGVSGAWSCYDLAEE